MNIRLCTMTKAMCRIYFQSFTHDSAVFADNQTFYEYQYSSDKADAYWKKNQTQDRIHLAIVLDDIPIGEVILKKIDKENKHCTLSIHMKNDSVKNLGYGTQAERLAINYAIDELGLETIFADTLIKNKRSQHVLEKNGFKRVRQDQMYVYYEYRKSG